MIRELTYRAEPRHPRSGYHATARYTETARLPWYYETDAHPSQEEAWAAALSWARWYNDLDRYGNMASAFGVVADPKAGWRGVVNYYHSNT